MTAFLEASALTCECRICDAVGSRNLTCGADWPNLAPPSLVHTTGNWSWHVLRRFTAMLLVGVSLLGPTSAVFACATGALDADCCPEGSSVACKDEAPGLHQAMPAACCVAAPAQSQKLTFESGRSARERDQNSGSPDLAINAGWPPPNRQFAHVHAAPHQGAPDSRIDGTLTYLLTGRLRL